MFEISRRQTVRYFKVYFSIDLHRALYNNKFIQFVLAALSKPTLLDEVCFDNLVNIEIMTSLHNREGIIMFYNL